MKEEWKLCLWPLSLKARGAVFIFPLTMSKEHSFWRKLVSSYLILLFMRNSQRNQHEAHLPAMPKDGYTASRRLLTNAIPGKKG